MNLLKQEGFLFQLKRLQPSTKSTEVINAISKLWKGIDTHDQDMHINAYNLNEIRFAQEI